MLADDIDAPGELDPGELRRRYERELAAVVDAVGRDRVSEATGVDDGVLDALADGGAPDLDLEDAAAILALADGAPDAGTILEEARSHLLLEMSNAMLNVDVIAGDLEIDLDPKEIQGMVEGRHPMTLDEYARLHRYIAAEADW